MQNILCAYIWAISRQYIKTHIKPNSPFSDAVVQGSYRFFLIFFAFMNCIFSYFLNNTSLLQGQERFSAYKRHAT